MSASAPPAPPSTDPTPGGRDSKGRFAAGNAGGPGNPFARQVAALRQALLDAVTAQDLADIAHAMMIQAKGGNVTAARLLLQYTLGKPAKAPDPDSLAVHEWQTFKEQAPIVLDLPGLIKAPDPEMTLHLLRAGRPAATQNWERRIQKTALKAERAAQRRAAKKAAKLTAKKAANAQAAGRAAPTPNPAIWVEAIDRRDGPSPGSPGGDFW